MQPSYIIEVRIKSIKGYAAFCTYQLGNTIEDAERIFACMEGSPINEGEISPFQMDLVECSKERSTILATQYCTLIELKENCHYISKEVFIILNL